MYNRDINIKFELVTPERVVMSDEISQITVPTKEGEITVLPKHMPLVSLLVPGIVELKNSKKEIKLLSVSGGFIEVLKNKVVILADTAERAEEIDLERAEEARRRAEQTIKDTTRFDQERFASINAAIAKELARTKAAKKWRRINSKS